MKHAFFGLKYLNNYWFADEKWPLICGIVLHNNCNLDCMHCRVPDRGSAHIKYEEAIRVVDSFYEKGGRCLYLEGGEPFIWKDRERRMDDIIRYAKQKGYHTTIIYTNGTWSLNSKADKIFISVDGLQENHDKLRGESFSRIMQNIVQSDHPGLFINYTINAVNKTDIESFCHYMERYPNIHGIFFYFHTPYYGFDHLYIQEEERIGIMHKLLELRKRYKILNSSAGLNAAIRNDWRKNSPIFQVYEDGEYYQCCRVNNDGELCKDCGYLSYAEVDQTLKMKPTAIRSAFQYF
jgi:MoaA/NifB/PqqE/SkfB family radical SAM enzyme